MNRRGYTLIELMVVLAI
ncbi:MAG: prepilin-type N-terminal cleavage/methylation domain-containing protein, partial [Phycisphaerae bacterium]|nr:prepilin-type N-terminal cleavage/methylation domain-containing protein [Phycisphaerae bacterium]